jgi:hypothetical protein
VHNRTEYGWRTSSKSSGANCVEIKKDGGTVFIRDSKDPSGDVLVFDLDAFREFIGGVKKGDHS